MGHVSRPILKKFSVLCDLTTVLRSIRVSELLRHNIMHKDIFDGNRFREAI